MFDHDHVNTEQEAYIIGILYADGCVTQLRCGKYRIMQLSFEEKDRDLLQKIVDIFNKSFNKSYVIKYLSKPRQYRFTFCLSDVIQQLIQLGIRPRKTYDNDDFVFRNIPDGLKPHFIRGYFDGDGCIYINKRNMGSASFVSCNHKLLESMLEYFRSIGIKGTLYHKDSLTRLIIGSNPACIKFMHWIYQDATICMQRKLDKFKVLEQICINKSNSKGESL